jgi:hypothetical protein
MNPPPSPSALPPSPAPVRTVRWLKRISPLQAGKMIACVYGSSALLIIPVLFGFSFFLTKQGGAQTSQAPSLLPVSGMGTAASLIIVYTVAGFLVGVIGAAIYNLFARWIGGFKFEVE